MDFTENHNMKKLILLSVILLLIPTITLAWGWSDFFDNLFSKTETPTEEPNLGGTYCRAWQGCTGTSTTPTDLKLLVGRGDGTYDLKKLTAGTNISFSTSTGILTITSTGGSGGSNWKFTPSQNAVMPTSTVGVIVSASSTFTGDLSAGNNTLFVDDAGYVGIATTTPEYALTVVGDVFLDPATNLFFGNVNNKIGLSGDDLGIEANAGISFVGTTILFDASGAGNDLYVNSSGYVGIATTTPEYPLVVNGDALLYNGALTASDVNVTDLNFNGGSFYFNNGEGVQKGRMEFNGTDGPILFDAVAGVAINFTINDVPYLVIDTTGNVGIGTTTPLSLLSIGTTYGSQFLINDLGYATGNLLGRASTTNQIGTLTNTKWCSTNGSVITCTENAPAGSGDITSVGTCLDGACDDFTLTNLTLTFGLSAATGTFGNINSSAFASSTFPTFAYASSTYLTIPFASSTYLQIPFASSSYLGIPYASSTYLQISSTSPYKITSLANLLITESQISDLRNYWTTTSASSWLNSSSTLAIDIFGNLTGNVTGNAETASALAADPADCVAGYFALGIGANGSSTCAIDSNTTYTAGDHLTLTATDFDVDDDFPLYAYASSTYYLQRDATSTMDYWETQQTARTVDDLSDNSISDLNDVGAMTESSGDLFYVGADNQWTRLASSTNAKVLTLVNGYPSWATPATGGGGSNWNVTSTNYEIQSLTTTSSIPVWIQGALYASSTMNLTSNLKAGGTIIGSNLSGTNTGDQDLSVYVSGAFATSTFLQIGYASSTFPTFSYATSTYYLFRDSTTTMDYWETKQTLRGGDITQAYASSTYLQQKNASSTYLQQANASSTFPTFTYASTTYSLTVYASTTFPTFAYASTTFPKFSYASSTFLQISSTTPYKITSLPNLALLENYVFVGNNAGLAAATSTLTINADTGKATFSTTSIFQGGLISQASSTFTGDLSVGTSTGSGYPVFMASSSSGTKWGVGIGTSTMNGGLLNIGTSTSLFMVNRTGELSCLSTATSTFTGGLQSTAIKLTQGAGAGKILTSDGNGYGYWNTASTGGGSNWQFYNATTLRPTSTVNVIFGNTSSTAEGNFNISGNATTTGNFSVGSDGAAQAGCIAIRDVGGAAWTYGRASAGTMTWSTVDCSGSATSTIIIGR